MRHTTNSNSRWYGGAAALCIVTLIASACTPLRLREPVRLDEAAWTTDLGATSRSRAVDAPAVFPLRQAWRYNASAGFGPGSALAADGLVIVSTRKGDVHAIEAETGRRKGIRKVVEVAEGAPVLTSNYLYVPSAWGGHVVNAYDLVRGRSQWKIKGAPVKASLLLEDGRLVIADVEGVVRAVNQETGEEFWRWEPEAPVTVAAAPVLISERTVAVAFTSGEVRTFDLYDGSMGWAQTLSAPVYNTAALLGESLLVPTTRGTLVELDIKTGAKGWTHDFGDPLTRVASPAANEAGVLVGGTDGTLRRLDPATGTELWRFETEGNISSAPLVVGNVLFVGTMSRMLFALDLATGSELWAEKLKGRVKSAPTVYKDRLIVLSEPQYVYAFDLTPEDVLATEDEPAPENDLTVEGTDAQ